MPTETATVTTANTEGGTSTIEPSSSEGEGAADGAEPMAGEASSSGEHSHQSMARVALGYATREEADAAANTIEAAYRRHVGTRVLGYATREEAEAAATTIETAYRRHTQGSGCLCAASSPPAAAGIGAHAEPAGIPPGSLDSDVGELSVSHDAVQFV